MKRKVKTFALLVILAAVITTAISCAPQSKYKKRAAVPCPCEKNNKR